MTKKNWWKTGYLIPSEIDPEETICVCVPIPKDWGHINAFLGQLTELSKWLTWEKDGTDNAIRSARRWMPITECVIEEINCIMSNDCGCGGNNVTNARINPETGIYEVSYDGGITWQPDPASDPRSSGVLFPPIPGDPGDTLRCQAANSVVGFFEDLQDQEHDQLVANSTIADMILALIAALSAIGFIFAFVPAAVTALLAFVVGTFGHLIAEDFDESFTSGTWDELLCIIFCHISDDGSFTPEAWQLVKTEAQATIGGYAGQWLFDHVNLVGVVGLTNAARASYPGTRTCDLCDCDNNCAEKYQIYNNDVFYGTIIEYGTNYIIVETGGTGFMTLEAINPADCCYVNSIEFLSGTGAGSAFRVCGDDTAPPWTAATPVGQCANIIEVQFTTGYPGAQVKIFLDECP